MPEASPEELLRAALEISETAAAIPMQYFRSAIAVEDKPDESPVTIADRETEVLRLVARGLTAKQIATRLVLSHRTVENHVQNTLRKLQLHNRAELVRYAIENGIDADEA